MELSELVEAAEQWLEQDSDMATQLQLLELLDGLAANPQAQAELADCFSSSLQFGTAGLRGALGPGPNRMNRVTVARAAAGLGQYLQSQGQAGNCIVIGYDGRHYSQQFAVDSAEIFAGLGFAVQIFESVVPTPVLAYSIRQLGACAGVMVTASHNPAGDNGYKVYLADGRQIVPPSDVEIAQMISLVGDVRNLARSSSYQHVSPEVIDNYIKQTAQLALAGPIEQSQIAQVQCVYTAMHGVGWQTFSSVLSAAGFAQPISVAPQQNPDPDFPTVKFPNPEEPGALDLAVATAKLQGGELILANDPDADRLAVALPTETGNWQMLRGDQVGVLLGWWVIERNKIMGKRLTGSFANSLVSSTQLAGIAKAAGLEFQATLTGFKWVSRVPNLKYGYEEALGYCVDPDLVSDKDGISAALLFLELFAYLKSIHTNIWQLLDEISSEFGLHVTSQISIRISDVGQVKHVMSSLRNSKVASIGPFVVEKFTDLAVGETLPATNGLIFELAEVGAVSWARVIVRPSGTEPKIKCYLEVKSELSDLNVAKQECDLALEQIALAMEPLLTGGVQ